MLTDTLVVSLYPSLIPFQYSSTALYILHCTILFTVYDIWFSSILQTTVLCSQYRLLYASIRIDLSYCTTCGL